MHILTICEGNICRSPLAAFALAQEFAARGRDVSVASAGLRSMAGYPMDPDAAHAASLHGVTPGEHQARDVSSELVTDADVVLTMTKSQRDRLISRYPRAMRKTFSLREFSKLVSMLPAGSTIAELALSRASAALTEADDVADPYRRGAEAHDVAAAAIVEASRMIAAHFS